MEKASRGMQVDALAALRPAEASSVSRAQSAKRYNRKAP